MRTLLLTLPCVGAFIASSLPSGAQSAEPSTIDVMNTGDTNGDGSIDLGDVAYLLNWLYLGGPAPVASECQQADPLAVGTGADAPQSQSSHETILYFLRHGEDIPELVGFDPSFTVTFQNCNAAGTCCEEVLNPLGRERAVALADWFKAKRITQTLTHVIASHKIRTRETVAKIAQAAGLGGDLDGDGTPDGTDVDQAPGDGVINVPSTPGECDPGWTGSSSVRQPQINYIAALPLGSRAVVCSHSPVVYPIMQAFGIDTSDPVKFPQDSRGRVRGFNNLWVVQLEPVDVDGALTYQGRLLEHIQFDFELEVALIDRDYGDGTSEGEDEEE